MKDGIPVAEKPAPEPSPYTVLQPVAPPQPKQSCPAGTTGIYPNCVSIPISDQITKEPPPEGKLACPAGMTGVYPNCVAKEVPPEVKPVCPVGTEGVYPDCRCIAGWTMNADGSCSYVPPVKEQQQVCPPGTTGVYPNCVTKEVVQEVKPCPAGYTGTYPDCYPPVMEDKYIAPVVPVVEKPPSDLDPYTVLRKAQESDHPPITTLPLTVFRSLEPPQSEYKPPAVPAEQAPDESPYTRLNFPSRDEPTSDEGGASYHIGPTYDRPVERGSEEVTAPAGGGWGTAQWVALAAVLGLGAVVLYKPVTKALKGKS